jgi:hypothetical protein
MASTCTKKGPGRTHTGNTSTRRDKRKFRGKFAKIRRAAANKTITVRNK